MESKKPWHLTELDGDWIIVSDDGKHVAHVLPQQNELEVMGNARVIIGTEVSDSALIWRLAGGFVTAVTIAAIAVLIMFWSEL